jgi:hypothetical protein
MRNTWRSFFVCRFIIASNFDFSILYKNHTRSIGYIRIGETKESICNFKFNQCKIFHFYAFNIETCLICHSTITYALIKKLL